MFVEKGDDYKYDETRLWTNAIWEIAKTNAHLWEHAMNKRRFLIYGVETAIVLWMLGATAATAVGQTPLPNGFEIRLLPGFTHEPLQGIDSIVGRLASKDGRQIQYEMGGIPAPGALRLGGHFVNQAQQLPEKDRLWLKEQIVGGRKVHVAYSKTNTLVISSASATEGVNFHTIAKDPGEVADALLMVFTLAEKKPKPGK